MKTMFNVWILLGILVSPAFSQRSYHPKYLHQSTHDDSQEAPYHLSTRSYHSPRHYESHEEGRDPRHYQSLELRYHRDEPETHARSQPPYHAAPQPVQYHHPEDPSYHRPQEIVYHSSPEKHQRVAPNYRQPSYHVEPEDKAGNYAAVEPSYSPELKYDSEPKYSVEPKYDPEPKYVPEAKYAPEPKYTSKPEYASEPKYVSEHEYVPDPKYASELKSVPEHQRSPSSHPAPVPTDPKLPLYFTMYEKRVIQDPVDKYGKGPWRYLTYGHGITYGSKEPGKVFEKGYGYIRALGRDHCKLPDHLCPPRDEKPFDYEGRKEPYFGYRPH